MSESKINIFRVSKFSGWVLAILILLYFISGYGIRRGFMDPVLAKKMHEKWLLIPTIIFFILHIFPYLEFKIRKWSKKSGQ